MSTTNITVMPRDNDEKNTPNTARININLSASDPADENGR